MAGFLIAIISGALMSVQGVFNTTADKEQQYLVAGIFCADYGICNVRADVVL